MYVRKLWLPGNNGQSREFVAETTPSAIAPEGSIREGDDGPLLQRDDLNAGVVDAVKVASLCNTAT